MIAAILNISFHHSLKLCAGVWNKLIVPSDHFLRTLLMGLKIQHKMFTCNTRASGISG